MTARQATKRLLNFAPKTSKCPICNKLFRRGCFHSIEAAYNRLKDDLLNAKIDKRVAQQINKYDRR